MESRPGLLVALERVRDWFNATNERTWLGHAVQAIAVQAAFGLVAWPAFSAAWVYVWVWGGVFCNLGIWGHRELEDGLKSGMKKFIKDGQFDLMIPLIASWALMVVEFALLL